MNSVVTYFEVHPDGLVREPTLTAKTRVNKLWQKARRMAREDMKKVIVRREDTLFYGDIEQKRAFFEGAIRYYYTAQTLEREPTTSELLLYREKILDEMLSYTYVVPKGLRNAGQETRGRTSTSAFDAQQWEDFFDLLDKSLFEPAGFVFPDRGEFKRLVLPKSEGGENLSHFQATEVLHDRLARIIKNRTNGTYGESEQK